MKTRIFRRPIRRFFAFNNYRDPNSALLTILEKNPELATEDQERLRMEIIDYAWKTVSPF